MPLRQSYVRVAKRAAMMVGRYAHAKQFNRMNRQLRFLRSRLGRLIRDIRRKIAGDAGLEEVFGIPLMRALQIRLQKQRQRGPKVYSWHAPETECIGKGKAHKPYEFGCKVSITTTNRRAKGGQFVLHARAFHGNPYDGHTLAIVLADTQALTGREIERVYVDKGYQGHDAPKPLRVYRSGQKRGVHGQIRRELRRRSAIEAVIGHLKTDVSVRPWGLDQFRPQHFLYFLPDPQGHGSFRPTLRVFMAGSVIGARRPLLRRQALSAVTQGAINSVATS